MFVVLLVGLTLGLLVALAEYIHYRNRRAALKKTGHVIRPTSAANNVSEWFHLPGHVLVAVLLRSVVW